VAQLIVRNLEEEVRDILRDATKGEGKRKGGVGSAITRLFQDIGLQREIPELKGTTPRASSLET